MRRALALTPRNRAEPTIALINIVFLMLIFFLIAGSLAPPPDADVALVALNEITTEPPSDALVMLADGSLRHAEQMPTSEAARAEFAGAARVRILPDRAALATDLVALAQGLRAAGGRGVGNRDRTGAAMNATSLLRACPQRDGCPLVRPRDLRRLHIAPRLKTVAFAAGVSVLVHLGAMAALAPRETTLIAGGGKDAPAALGTSFADLAEGVLTPSEAELVDPDAAGMPEPEALPEPVRPVPTETTEATQPALALPTAADPSDAVLPAAPQQDQPSVTLAPPQTAVPPEQLEASPQVDRADAARPEALAPDISPTERAPETSRKPPPRPDRTAQAQPTRQPPAPQGNAPQTATRGNQQGTQGQAAREAPARAQATAQGNAAASNYPGEVLRRIQRVRQARSPARGQVLVSFSVGENGALAAVSVARSSSHAGLDQIALDHIRRAAPFPPPPSGAQRQFSFEFVGR